MAEPVPTDSSLSPAAAPASADAGPLSTEHFEQLARADAQAATLGRTLRMANFNAWTLGIMAALSLVIGLMDVESVVVGGLLAVFSFIEFRGRALVQKLDLRGPLVLGWNQVSLLIVLVGYGIWKLMSADGANPYAQVMKENPEIVSMLQPIVDMYAYIYMLLIGIAVIYQGGSAVYYFTRRRHLQSYLADTPEWIIKLQQSRGSRGNRTGGL